MSSKCCTRALDAMRVFEAGIGVGVDPGAGAGLTFMASHLWESLKKQIIYPASSTLPALRRHPPLHREGMREAISLPPTSNQRGNRSVHH